MTPSRTLTTILWLIAVLFVLSCSSHGNSPASPTLDLESSQNPLQEESPGEAASGTMCWGLWDVSIDPETWTASTVLLRSAEFAVNVTQYLQPPLGTTANIAIIVTDMTLYATQGIIWVDVTLTHPFPSNPEFAGFDVMGVFMHNGSSSSQVDSSARWATSTNDAQLLNLDGYTRWMNQKEFTTTGLLGFTPGALGTSGTWTATVNPYKYFADGLHKTDDLAGFYQSSSAISNRGVFKAGGKNTREYQLQFPLSGGSPVLTFQYAVVARWEQPSPTPPNNVPGDFPANANAQEAIYAYIWPFFSTLNYHPSVGGSGTLAMDIEVFDWQGSSNPSGFPAEISAIWVEGFTPGLIPGGAVDVLPGASQFSGSCATSWIFRATVPNCTPAHSGNEWVLVTMESASPTNYDSGYGAPYPSSAKLAGYSRFAAPVTNYSNSQPYVPTPTGPAYIWEGQTVVFTCAATDNDPGDNLTYTWSIVQTGFPPVYNIPGDSPQPDTNTLTITMNTANSYPPGTYDISCQVQDSSGQPNDFGQSPSPLTRTVYVPPYAGNVPANQLDQVIVAGIPSLHGGLSCPWYWDGFYQPVMSSVPFCHAEISILSGPSLGSAGVMVIADEIGALVTFPPPPPWVTGFAHFTCPFVTGNVPSWTWWTTGLTPSGPDMIPSVIHFDGNINTEFLFTNSQMTGVIWPVPDPSTFEHYQAWPAIGKLNDLYTSLAAGITPDVAVDSTAGFDMGTPVDPDNPSLYGLYTQDRSGILFNCFGPGAGGVLNANPVHFLQFPSLGNQPVGITVDAGGPGVVAPLPQALVSQFQGAGGGVFCIGPGGPCPKGTLQFPEPFYALAVDDDPDDNPWGPGLPNPSHWVLAATIDSERDLEIYEIDFGQPTPAPIQSWSSLTMGNFMGGNAQAYPLDCEFCSNFSDFGGTTKKVSDTDLLAVLLTDQAAGGFVVEIFEVTPGTPTSIAVSMLIPLPPMSYGVHGVAYRLDVDEVTGDIYVIHESMVGGGGLGVTIFSY